MNEKFPASYFAAWASPKKMFANRKQLKLWQMLFVVVFLFMLMLIPVPLYYQHQQKVDLNAYMPVVKQMLSNQQLDRIVKKTDFSNDQYHFQKSQVIKQKKGQLIGISLTKKQVNKAKAAVVLCDKYFYFREQGITYKLYYASTLTPTSGKWQEQLIKTWYLRNKAQIAFSMMVLVGSLFLMTDLLILGVGSFFLWLGKHSPAITIDSFKESLNVMLNILGPASFIAFALGTLHFDMALMLMIQSLAVVILFLVVYAKTHFNDYYLAEH